jgi:hypothetical protein
VPAIPQFTTIDDAIAEDVWSYATPDGTRATSRITVGRPRPWPEDSHGDWLCPISIEHYTGGVRAIAGVGPVDALLNAIDVVKAFAEEIGHFAPRPQGSSRERSGK